MKRLRVPDASVKFGSRYQPQLSVVEFFATRRGDADRGPMLWLSGKEARRRLLEDGELAWVTTPRRRELAVVRVDDAIPEGQVVVRDLAGVVVSESIAVQKPDLDTTGKGPQVG